MSPILGIWASSKAVAAADTGAMFPLQVVTVGAAGASSVTFTNIPATYSHLQIRGLNKTTAGTGNEWLKFEVNGATTNIVSRHTLLGDGSSATAEADTSTQTNWFAFGSADSTASAFGVFVMDILDYANTNKNKTFRTLSGWDKNGSGYVALNSNLWNSTSAITSLKILPRTNSFAQYSQFALYGVKNA
jgi:hypothetical protein